MVDAADYQEPFGVAGEVDAATEHFRRYQREGDRSDLEKALLAAAPVLFRSARRHWGADAEDLVQDCFAAAIASAQQFDSGRPLLPWLYGILHRVAASRSRRRWGRTRVMPDVAELLADAGPGPDEVVDREVWLEQVRTRLGELPEKYRLVLERHLLRGEQLVDIASSLDRSPSTVRTQFERGLHQLRRRLPAPLLAGVTAMLAAGGASAQTHLGRPWLLRPALAGAALVAGVPLLAWMLGPRGDGGTSVLAEVPAAAAAPAPSPSASAPTAPTAEPARVPLPAAAPVRQARIRLRLPDGAPAVGMAVILDASMAALVPRVVAARTWRIAYTDANGEVLFTELPLCELGVRLHDQSLLQTFCVGPEERSFEFTVHPVQQLTVGVETMSGEPLPGATIMVSAGNGFLTPGHPAAVTDQEGNARIASILGRFAIWAKAEGFATSQYYWQESNSRVEVAGRRKLRLAASDRQVRGRVVADDGRPLAGALVDVWNPDLDKVPPARCATDAHGEFVAGGLIAGPFCATAMHREFAPAVVAGGADDQFITLRLGLGGSIAGSATNVDAARAQRCDLQATKLGVGGRDQANRHVASVRADGSFEFARLAAGRYRISWYESGAFPVASQLVDVVDGQVARMEFPAADLQMWPVRVVDAHGAPVRCQLRSEGELGLVHPERYQFTATTDAGGTAQLPTRIPAQPLYVHLPVRGVANDLPALALGVVSPGTPMTIELTEDRQRLGSVRGVVPTSYRGMVARGGLELTCPGGSRRVAVGRGGVFATDDVPAGDYRLRMHAGTYRAPLMTVSVAPGQALDLGTLPELTFGDWVLQLPAAEAWLMVRVRDSSGSELELIGLEPNVPFRRRYPVGRYRLEFAGASAEPMSREFDVTVGGSETISIQRASGRACNFVANEGTTLLRSPQAVAELQRVGASSGVSIPMWVSGPTRAYSAKIDLLPGSYRVRVVTPWGDTVATSVEVIDDPAANVFELQLP